MKTFELILHPPKLSIPCIFKTTQANSIEEFANICDNDSYLYELFSSGWTIAGVRVKKVV